MDRAKRIFTIPPSVSFVDALAAGIVARFGAAPLALAEVTVLLPTRRACRALTDAFLRCGDGRAMVLPNLSPIGDVDEDDLAFDAADEPALAAALEIPPQIAQTRRTLLLTELIRKAQEAAGGAAPLPAQAARLAQELARLLDQVQVEQLSFDALATLVPEKFSAHWQITLKFLSLLTDHWPDILAAEGCIDPADRRNRLIAARAELWRRAPPQNPVVVAGSTGSIPATADLIAAACDLPRGMLVLPGLDTAMQPECRAALEPSHPQYGMQTLLRRLRIDPEDVAPWPSDIAARAAPQRAAVLSAAMRPALAPPVTPDRDDVAAALRGVRRIDCPGTREEAGVVALLMREALETEGRTAALVTPDRFLARRVAAELERWGIEIDDSAGIPLKDTPPGVFLRLAADMVAEDFAPVPLLAALKHPFASAGLAAAEFRGLVRALEIAVLRGPRPGPGVAGLRRAVALDPRCGDRFDAMLDALDRATAEFAALLSRREAPLAELVAAHVRLAEALSATDREPGAKRLWSGDDGEALAGFVDALSASAASLSPVAVAGYIGLLETLMGPEVVRPHFGRHPRLHIWGPLEARIQHADLIVMGSLNEGVWPPDPGVDPWMSRPMRADFGLSPPERRIGLSAHDFAQAFSAPEIVLTRATRSEGTPTVPSRWLLRVENVIDQVDPGGALKEAWRAEQGKWLDWQAQIDRPGPTAPLYPPGMAPDEIARRQTGPAPPLDVRPRRLSVTQIETLRRDPYAVFARHILGLRPLDPLDADPGAAERGTIIHDALDRFLREHPEDLPQDALDRLLQIGREEFGAHLAQPGVKAFWWPRFERVAAWFVEAERAYRADVVSTATEVSGTVTFDAPGGPFELVAKADRVDVLSDGTIAIADYKTGTVPQKQEIALGYSPQLPLESAMAARGGFDGIPAAPVSRLAFWKLSGGDPGGEIRPAADDPATLGEEAFDGLIALIAHFDDPETAYEPVPNPYFAPKRSDYAHLARLMEYVAFTGEDGA